MKKCTADPPKPEWVEFEYGNSNTYRRGLIMLPKAIAKELGEKVGKLKWELTKDEEAEPFTKEQATMTNLICQILPST